MPDDGPGLFTIGHSNLALDDFLSLLQRHGIEAVADVRTVPWSRYVPHFNAKALGAALASRGIGYVPLGRELGGRPAADEFYDEEGHVLYGRLAGSAAFHEGIDQVLARGRTSRIALLCSEEDPAGATATCSSGACCGSGPCRVPHQARRARRDRGGTGGPRDQRRTAGHPV